MKKDDFFGIEDIYEYDQLPDGTWKCRISDKFIIFLMCNKYAKDHNVSLELAYSHFERVGLIEKVGDSNEQKR